jgi:MFS family permease
VSGNYGLGYWLPTIVQDFARTAQLDEALGVGLHTATGVLVAVPYGLAAIAMVFWTRRSDRRGERIWHVAAPSIAGGCALAAAALASDPWLALVAMTICAICTYAALPTFWTLPTAFLSGTAAAGGIAFVNSLGNLGGFVGPYLLGRLRDAEGTPAPGLVALAGCYVVAGIATLLLSRPPRASARSGDAASHSPRS